MRILSLREAFKETLGFPKALTQLLDDVHYNQEGETTEIWKWMAQAEADAQRFQDGAPAVFFRRSRSPWCVVMKLEDWMNLYQAAETGENRK